MPKQMLIERWFAKTYGWPPSTVRALPLETLHWFPIIETAEARAQQLHADQDRPRGGGR
jgi:hypothetical protein